MTTRAGVSKGELLLSLGLLALGAFVLYETQSIAEAQGYAQIGPRLFPSVIGAGLAICGAMLAWHAVAGGWRNMPPDQLDHASPDWTAFATISAGIVLHMAVIGYVGFILAGVLLFVLVARGFGSRRVLRDALVALVLSAVVYVIFTRVLGLRLPALPLLDI
jgi:putative tricarboxylic transport membrane protein